MTTLKRAASMANTHADPRQRCQTVRAGVVAASISRRGRRGRECAVVINWAAFSAGAAESRRECATWLPNCWISTPSARAKAGYAFKHDKEQYQLFLRRLPFEATPDQAAGH